MELLLALAVITAVIVFGALISIGNERQRRAIDELREQVVLWAIQDLRIKREHLAREVRVDDPIGWLNRLAMKAWGGDSRLQVVEFHEQPQALVCAYSNNERIFFSPLSPAEIQKLKLTRKSRLGQYANGNPLLNLPHGIKGYEFSMLNSGISFDLELPLAWKELTGQDVTPMEQLWAYRLA